MRSLSPRIADWNPCGLVAAGTGGNGDPWLWRGAFALFVWLLVATLLPAAAPNPGMIRVRLGGGLVEGQPLAWSERSVALLARDGQLHSFDPKAAKDFDRSAPAFYGYSPSELRARLAAEFGREYEIRLTQHYVVVHAPDQGDRWANRFEGLYRAFCQYFQVRGFALKEPRFPLIAIVFPSQAEYRKYSAANGMQIPANYLGHYSGGTNRVYLFDSSSKGSDDWATNADTIIHEATHQTAFNTGVHNRFGGAPRWVSEGLATMFEPAGVWNGSATSQQGQRINAGRFADFRAGLPLRKTPLFPDLIASDRLFDSQPRAAYAEAWAFSFYLSETRPRLYAQYLARTAARPDFQDYPAAERLKDFTAIFGDNLAQLDAQFVRWVQALPAPAARK